MSTQQQSIQNNEILQAAFDKLSPEERLALETLATVNVLKRQAGLAPKTRAPEAEAKKIKAKPRQPRKRLSRRKPSPPSTKARHAANLSHESRCGICRHEERDAIEEAFLHWQSPRDIQDEFGVAERAIYRHAHAVGLFPIRSRNLRFALGRIIERADRIAMTPECVIRAIHAFAKVNDEGQWVEPPKRIIISKVSYSSADDPKDDDSAGDVAHAQPRSAASPGALDAPAPAVKSRTQLPPEGPAEEAPVEPALPLLPPATSEPEQPAPRVWPKPAFVLDRSKFAHW